MNIYQVPISVLFLFAICIDKSVVFSKVISDTRQAHATKEVDSNSVEVMPLDGSIRKYDSETFFFGSDKIKIHKDKISNEENTGEKSSEEKEREKSGEDNGGLIFKNESGSSHSGEEHENNNSKEEKKSDNSNENNESENSSEKNGNEGDNRKFGVGHLISISHNFPTQESFHDLNQTDDSHRIPKNYLLTIDSFHKARPFEYQYHAAIVWKPNGRLLCQGAFIKPRWVVTSASCIKKFRYHHKAMVVLIGATSLQSSSYSSREVLKMVINPHYIEYEGLNDFALLLLDNNVNPIDNFEPVALSKPYEPNKGKCEFSTFIGTTLYGKEVDYVFQEECDLTEIGDQVLPYFCAAVNGSLIQSKKTTTLGSPLVCGGVIYGIKTEGALFTAVDSLIPWMNRVFNWVNRTQDTTKPQYTLGKIEETVYINPFN